MRRVYNMAEQVTIGKGADRLAPILIRTAITRKKFNKLPTQILCTCGKKSLSLLVSLREHLLELYVIFNRRVERQVCNDLEIELSSLHTG